MLHSNVSDIYRKKYLLEGVEHRFHARVYFAIILKLVVNVIKLSINVHILTAGTLNKTTTSKTINAIRLESFDSNLTDQW